MLNLKAWPLFLVKCDIINVDVSPRIGALLLQLDPQESRTVSDRSSSQSSQICAVTSILLTSHTRIPAGMLQLKWQEIYRWGTRQP